MSDPEIRLVEIPADKNLLGDNLEAGVVFVNGSVGGSWWQTGPSSYVAFVNSLGKEITATSRSALVTRIATALREATREEEAAAQALTGQPNTEAAELHRTMREPQDGGGANEPPRTSHL